MQALKKEEQKAAVSQFSLTTDLLRNLHKFNLTPATKLVLLELTTHYNSDRNGAVVFPSVSYIAEVLGIGLTATKKAINDLIREGLIIKSKRDKVRGNYNKYVLTLKVQNTAKKPPENKLLKQPGNGLFLLRTDNKEQIKEQTVQNKGGNVYSGDDKILYEYAKTRAKYSVDAFIQKIKENGGANKIICEYKKKKNYTQMNLHRFDYTQKLGEIYKGFKEDRVMPEECATWVKFGKKIGIKK